MISGILWVWCGVVEEGGEVGRWGGGASNIYMYVFGAKY